MIYRLMIASFLLASCGSGNANDKKLEAAKQGVAAAARDLEAQQKKTAYEIKQIENRTALHKALIKAGYPPDTIEARLEAQRVEDSIRMTIRAEQ